MYRPPGSVLVILLVAFLSMPATAAELTGKAIHIADGDSFTLLVERNVEVRIRLAEIDAPESGQPYGDKSRRKLASLIHRKAVHVDVQTTDRYGRKVGRVYVGDIDINSEMVASGSAWVYRQYLRDGSLLDLEALARAEKRGLWSTTEAQRQPPWEWRRNGQQESAPAGCLIKGNINSKGARIYHLPGQSNYGATKINEAKGERWFCSEEEARLAGWRPAR